MIALCLVACSSSSTRTPRPEPPVETPPPEPVVDPPAEPAPFAIRIDTEAEDALDDAVTRAIARGTAPGAVLVLGRRDGIVFQRAYGDLSTEPTRRPMPLDARFDLASVTKVFTAVAVMRLRDQGRLSLDADVRQWIPTLDGRTVRDLLLHRAGLVAVDPLGRYDSDRAASLARVFAGDVDPPGEYRYSDLGYIALGEIVSRVMEAPLDAALHELVMEPLALEAAYRPNAAGGGPTTSAADPRVVPTERAAHRGEPPPIIEGEVNDPRAWRLGGIAGHAGLFASAHDVATLAHALMSPGLLSAEALHEMTERHGDRGLGLDMRRRVGSSARAFGHGGYTGTWFWVDPENDFYTVLLTNRVHPDGGGRGDLGALRDAVARIAAGAVPHAIPIPTEVMCGIDVLRAAEFEPLAGARVALFTNRSGVARDGTTTRELLAKAQTVELVRLFAPEHGLSADQEGRIEDGRSDGVPVVGLFGPSRDPAPETLADVDAVVIDIQDVGARFYTYMSTMHRLLRAAATAGKLVVILDRPNPLGGVRVEGPVVQEERLSFVEHHPLPILHGLTMGELARLIVVDEQLELELEVIAMRGWDPAKTWREVGLRWVASSPNLRTLPQVELYPGVALAEGMDISVGRGTDHPFEQVGAPWLDPAAVSARLAGLGYSFEAVRFRPRGGPHRGRPCAGVRITGDGDVVELGFGLLTALHAEHANELDFSRAGGLVGDDRVLTAIVEGRPREALPALWAEDLDRYRARRQAVLLYPRD